AVGHDFAGHLLEFLELAAHQHHVRAERGEFVRGATADARAPAGDHDDPAGEHAGRENGTVALTQDASPMNKPMAAAVRPSSVAPWRLSYHWADQLSAPKIS